MERTKKLKRPLSLVAVVRGLRLRELRRARRLPSEAVARELAMTAGSVLRHERGEVDPSSDALLKYAELYGVTTEFLLRGSD